MNTALITHGLLAALCIAGTHSYMNTRHELELSRVTVAEQGRQIEGAQGVITRANKLIQQVQENAESTAKLQNTLRDLRTDVNSVRSDIAKRITTASRDSLAQYAAACNDVFGAMAAGGERLSIIGAGIAQKADGHAVDARLIPHQ